MSTALIVLAAGRGTRMASDTPKVLHPLAGAPLLHHTMQSGGALSPDRTVIVTGHGAEAVAAAAMAHDPAAQIVQQTTQNGTADAVACARAPLADFDGDVFVLYGDTPLIRPETLSAMAAARRTHDLVVLGFETDAPGNYGRLVMSGDELERIVEANEATLEERSITLCNSGVISASTATIFSLIEDVSADNARGEYYLTDIVGIARAGGLSATVVIGDASEMAGVDSRAGLARAEATFQARARDAALASGVTLTAPETVFFAHDTEIGPDTTVEPHVVFGPGVSVEGGARIRAFCYLEGCHLGAGAEVGPFARLRPGAKLAARAHIGNFVELKNARLGAGAKANHLTYLGDAEIGAGANIGAGTITCNYDGIAKHRTEIGAGAFIGSDTMLVAPVTVGAEAITGSGSVITDDVPDGALAIARTRQETKPGIARKIMEKFKAAAGR